MSEISIVMATYNGSFFLKKQIESIINCDRFDELVKEFIISDDNSTDDTLMIINEYASNKSFRIKILKNEISKGVIGNFTNGIRNSEGEFIVLSDQDDIWEKDKLNSLYSVAKKINEKDTPLVIVSDSSLINSDDREIASSFFKENHINLNSSIKPQSLVVKNFAQGCVMLFNKRMKDTIDFNNNNGWIMHDWWILLIASKIGHIGVLNKPLVKYRIHSGNVVGMNKDGLLYKLLSLKKTSDEYKISIRKRINQHDEFNKIFHLNPVKVSFIDFIKFESTIKRKVMAMLNVFFIYKLLKGK